MDSKEMMEMLSEKTRLAILMKKDAETKRYLATIGKAVKDSLDKFSALEQSTPKLYEQSNLKVTAIETKLEGLSKNIESNIRELLRADSKTQKDIDSLARKTENLVNSFSKSTKEMSNEIAVMKKIVDSYALISLKEREDGKDGKGIERAYLDAGKLILVYTDGTHDNLGKVTAPGNDMVGQIRKGGRGDTGTGIASITLTSGDHSPGTLDTYTITYTDASVTPITYEVYNGADGLAVIRDNLTTQSATDALSANQGYVLNNLVSTMDNRIDTIITTPVEGVSAQEIIDARGGEVALGGRLNGFDLQFAETFKGIINLDYTVNNALQSAITATTSGIIYVKPGITEFDSLDLTDKENIVIQGAGKGITTLRTKTLLSTLSVPDIASLYAFVLLKNSINVIFKDLTIEGLWITGGGLAYSDGVVVNGTSKNITFENVEVKNMPGEGITAQGLATNVIAEKCNIHNCRNSAYGGSVDSVNIKLLNCIVDSCGENGSSSVSINGTDFEIKGNRITNCLGAGLILGHTGQPAIRPIIEDNFIEGVVGTIYSAVTIVECYNARFGKNKYRKFSYGLSGVLWTVGDGLNASKEDFAEIVNDAFAFRGKSKLIITDNDISGGIRGMRFYDCQKSIISGNNISNLTAEAIKMYFEVTGCKDNRVLGNTIDGCTIGIDIFGGGGGNFIDNRNKITNASVQEVKTDIQNVYYAVKGEINEYKYSTTPVLDGNADGTSQTPSLNVGCEYVLPPATVGGNYVVARFDNGYVGQVVNMLAVDAYTVFKNGNNLSLGADVTTVANKVYTFKGIAKAGTLKFYLISVN